MISAPTAPGAGIGSRVREARQSAGLTQGALAALVGVARHTVWCWEAGRNRPRRKHLARVALHCDTGFRELDACEEAGLIVRARGLARAVRLTEAGRTFAEAASETGSLPARREEIASIAPRAAAAPAAASDAPPPPVLQLREGRSRPRERTR